MDTEAIDSSPEPAHPEWTLSQERVFIEELVHKRLTLYLAFFAIIMAGTVNTVHAPALQLLILFVGVVVCGALGEAVVRSHEKLDIALRKINQDSRHPVTWTNQFALPKRRSPWVGIVVPRFCTAILLALLILAVARLLRQVY